jgi:hypothetical protein
MTLKPFLALPAVLLALSTVPASALDISIGGSVGGRASCSTGDSGLSAGLGASASASVEAGGSSDDADDTSDSASASASTTGSVSLDVDENDPLLDVMLLIRSSNWSKTSLSGLSDFNGQTHDVDVWLNSENSSAFEQTLSAHAGDIADLQYAAAANADFNAWLNSENTDASAVVAVGVSADGSLTVFTHN